MTRRIGYVAVLVGAAALVASRFVASYVAPRTVAGISAERVAVTGLLALAVVVGTYGVYLVVRDWLTAHTVSKRRQHDLRNVLRLAFGLAGAVALLGAVTEQWVGVLFSLGVVGFAVTFALQQPLFSLIGWVYIMVNRPYQVGDRVAIEDSKGDVVASNQPSGRIITLPNSVVLSSQVKNYTRERVRTVADDLLGDEMERNIDSYREQLSETPVELEVQDRPTVNVVQEPSWVQLRLRYLVHPRRGQRTKNRLYEGILAEFNEHPDRVKFPVSRNR